MIDFDYRIIFKKERFYVQERKRPVHTNEIVNWEDVKIPYRESDYHTACTVGGSVANLSEAEHFVQKLIKENTYDVIFDTSYGEGIE
jgi:hypothetical protein